MRTTLTLDPDVAARLNTEVERSARAFKVVVNDALRRGLKLPTATASRRRFVVQPRSLRFRPGIDSDKLNALVAELETEAQSRSLSR